MARRAKKQTVESDRQASNMSLEERWAKHVPTILAAKADADKAQDEAKKANNRYRSLLKSAKKEGINVDMLCKAFELQKRDPQDIDKDFRDLNAYLKLLEVPVGTQLGLFADGRTVATAIEDERQKDQGLERKTDKGMLAIEADGLEAGLASKNADDNPYEDGSPEFLRWRKGWNDGHAKLVEGLAGKPKTNGRHAETHLNA